MLAHARPALMTLALALFVAGLGYAVAQQSVPPAPTPPTPTMLGAIVEPTGNLLVMNPADAAHDITDWHPRTGDGSN